MYRLVGYAVCQQQFVNFVYRNRMTNTRFLFFQIKDSNKKPHQAK